MKTFEELGVAAPILKAIQEMGYESPMPVQEEVIPFLLGDDNDVIALAQTGTGKTAAFGLPILQKIDVTTYHPQALVLCPTRELCLQIADDLNDYSKYIDNLKVLPVYGGSSIESQIKTLKRGVHVVVATPGRLLDLMNRKTVDLSLVKNVIMDEADEMLNMGFTDSINAILAEVPENRNMLLFSATMPKEIANITKKYMKNPKEIVIGNKNEGNKNIRDIYYMVQGARTNEDVGQVLVFESEDKINWKFRNRVESENPFGYMWECPDYFEIGTKKLLSTSVQGLEGGIWDDCNVYQSGYFEIEGDILGEYKLSEYHLWDYGFDYYAPQSFETEDGRRIHISWMGMPDCEEYTNPTIQTGWQHCFTFPREIFEKDGKRAGREEDADKQRRRNAGRKWISGI